jgi:hypothetical protein
MSSDSIKVKVGTAIRVYNDYRTDSTKTAILDVWEGDGKMQELLDMLISKPQAYKLSKGRQETVAQLDRDLRFEITALKKARRDLEDDTIIRKIEKRIDSYFSSTMMELEDLSNDDLPEIMQQEEYSKSQVLKSVLNHMRIVMSNYDKLKNNQLDFLSFWEGENGVLSLDTLLKRKASILGLTGEQVTVLANLTKEAPALIGIWQNERNPQQDRDAAGDKLRALFEEFVVKIVSFLVDEYEPESTEKQKDSQIPPRISVDDHTKRILKELYEITEDMYSIRNVVDDCVLWSDNQNQLGSILYSTASMYRTTCRKFKADITNLIKDIRENLPELNNEISPETTEILQLNVDVVTGNLQQGQLKNFKAAMNIIEHRILWGLWALVIKHVLTSEARP